MSLRSDTEGRWSWILLTLFLGLSVAGASWWLGWKPLGSSASPGLRGGVTDDRGGAGAKLEELSLASPSGPLPPGQRGALLTPSGTVRLGGPGKLQGTVLDRATGQGLGEAEVVLLPVPPVGADAAKQITRLLGVGADFRERIGAVATSRTDARGAFAFTGVREGRWYVHATAPHFVSDTPVSARVLATGAGGPVEVWMRPGGRVIGQVVDSKGTPVPSADVSLTTSSMGILEAAANGEVALLRSITDPEGRFAFPGVSAGEGYEIAVLGPGIAITHLLGIEVRVGEDTEVVVRGRPAAAITGRVFTAAKGGDEPEPLAGAKVGALPRGLRNLKLAKELLQSCHGLTDEEGRYLIEGVAPGTIDVLAMADGHLPARGPMVRVPGSHPEPVLVKDFILESGPMLSGRVVNEEGTPLAGVRVLWNVVDLQAVEGQPSLAPLFIGGMEAFEFPITGADGEFRAGPFPGAAPHSVRAVKPGYATGMLEWTPLRTEEPLEWTLTQGYPLEGTAIDAATGLGIKSFTVSVTSAIEEDPGAPSRFNPFAGGTEFEGTDGRFRLGAVAPGAQTLRVSAEGYLPAAVEVHVEASLQGQPAQEVKVPLDPGATLRGLVTDVEGAPVAGAQITTEASIASAFERLEAGRVSIEGALAVKGQRRVPGGTPPVGLLRHFVALGIMGEGVALSGPDGAFSLTGLPLGPTEVLAFHRDYAAAAVLAEVRATEPDASLGEPVVLVLREGGGLKGRVTDRFKQPLAEAMVIAVSPGLSGEPTMNGEFHQARTGTDGAFVMRNMEAGPYFVLATRGDEDLSIMGLLGTLNFSLVQVPMDRLVTLDLVDTSAGSCRVHGQITRGGRPVTGGTLVGLNLESEGFLGLDIKVAPVENDGTYSFEGLAPGEVQLTYEGPGPGGRFLVDVPEAPELRADLELPEGVLGLRVVARDTGEPVAGARATLTRAESSLWAGSGGSLLGGLFGASGTTRQTSDDAGLLRFIGLERGAFTLVIEGAPGAGGAGFAPLAPMALEFGEGEELDLGDVALDPGVTADGVLLDEDGAPISGGEITAVMERATGEAPEVPRGGTSDGGGRFQLLGLGPGTWRVSASAKGFATGATRSLVVDEAGAAGGEELRLVLSRGVLVDLSVTGPSGEPLEGVASLLRPVGSPMAQDSAASRSFFRSFFAGSSTTDSEGRMQLGRFGSGPHLLTVTLRQRRAQKEVDLPSSGEATLEIELP